MAWQNFIHPEFVGRTMQILKRNMNNPVEMEQMYRHKDGRYFKATDTHRIFLNPEGKTTSTIFF